MRSVRMIAGILFLGCLILSAQQPPAVFTAAQAEAGRQVYARTCSQCHTSSLLGRKGDSGERPPLSSLTPTYQKFIGPRGFVAPLTGPTFIERWGAKSASQLIARFQETVDDPTLNFQDMGGEATVNLTAYILQVNGAQAGAQPLTRSTEASVLSLVR
jgi:mono/diheme cytochrome c family protein